MRFIPKQWMGKEWGVYDVERGSWPRQLPGYGAVRQHVSQDDALTEATRLNEFFGSSEPRT